MEKAWTDNPKELVDIDYIAHEYVYDEMIKVLNKFEKRVINNEKK